MEKKKLLELLKTIEQNTIGSFELRKRISDAIEDIQKNGVREMDVSEYGHPIEIDLVTGE